ncbi:hypothetical protein D3C77_749350 [compost metagenome]
MLLNWGKSVDLPVVGKSFVICRQQAQRVFCSQLYERSQSQMTIQQQITGLLSHPVNRLGMYCERFDYPQLADGS